MQDLVAPQDKPVADSEIRIKSAELKIIKLTDNLQVTKDEITNKLKGYQETSDKEKQDALFAFEKEKKEMISAKE